MAVNRPHLRRAAPVRFATPVGAGSAPPVAASPQDDPQDNPSDEPQAHTPVAPIHFPTFTTASVALDPVTVEDVDQLWDWVRSDRDGTTDFLGFAHANSQQFNKQIGDIIIAQRDGFAWFRSVRNVGALIGFVALQIAKAPASATIRIYLEPGQRGRIKDVIEATAQQTPVPLVCITADKELAGIFVECGFTSQYVLTRPPISGAGNDRR